MKPMSLFFAGILFVAVIISGTGWYGALVSDYSDLNATEKINTTKFGHTKILGELNETQAELDTDLKSGVKNIPFIGGELVQVFSTFQMLKSFMLSLWDAMAIGTQLLTGMEEIIPWVIHPTILALLQISLVMLFIGSLVYLLLNRRVT